MVATSAFNFPIGDTESEIATIIDFLKLKYFEYVL